MSKSAAPRGRRSSFAAIGKPLPPSFYNRATEVVARELLGCVLVHDTPEGRASGRIVETEAYLGEHDPACHAAAGYTNRTKWLYGPPGTAYVYFIYGVHWCFNVVTRAAGLPSAVLVRALEPLDGMELMRSRRPRARSNHELTNGPGKLCAALRVDGRHNGLLLSRGELRVLAGDPVPARSVVVVPRVGITKAADWPLRWFDRRSAFVSPRIPTGR